MKSIVPIDEWMEQCTRLEVCVRVVTTASQEDVKDLQILKVSVRRTSRINVLPSVQPEFVTDPRILCRTFVACVQESILLQHTTVQLARVRQITNKFGRFKLLPFAAPRVKLIQCVGGRRVSHPLDCLVVGHEVNIWHFRHIIHESTKCCHIFRFPEPRRMKIQAVWGPVR